MDPRSLALMRIGIGLSVLVQIAIRLPDLEAHFSDDGYLPRALVAPGWSLFFLNGSWLWAASLFVLGALAALALLLGWRTRPATLLTLLFVTSLAVRNPFAHVGADMLLRLALVYGLFLPWDRHFAVHPPGDRNPCWSFSPLAWRLQLSLVYLFSGFSKASAMWWSGRALDYALHSDCYARPLALALAGVLDGAPWLYPWLGRLVVTGEILLGLAILVPRLQSGAALLLMAMHVLFGLALRIDEFPVVCVACLASLLTWKEPLAPLRARGPRWPALALAVFALLVNLSHVRTCRPWLHWIRWPAQAAGLQQQWRLFAPPPRTGGYRRVVGQTWSGQEVDLTPARGGDRSWHFFNQAIDRPTARTRTCLRPHGLGRLRRSIASAFQRRWEREHADRLVEVRLIYMRRRYRPGLGYGPYRAAVQYRYRAR